MKNNEEIDKELAVNMLKEMALNLPYCFNKEEFKIRLEKIKNLVDNMSKKYLGYN